MSPIQSNVNYSMDISPGRHLPLGIETQGSLGQSFGRNLETKLMSSEVKKT